MGNDGSSGHSSSSQQSKKLSFKDEWHMFWESFAPEGHSKDKDDEFNDFKSSDLPAFSEETFFQITRKLSKERQSTHLKLEKINKEIDLVNAKIESLRLVGGEEQESLARLSELTEQGYELSSYLEKLDEKMKIVRSQRRDFDSL